MKLVLKYDGGQDEFIDYILETMVEYMMVECEVVGRGFNHEAGIRDIEFDVTELPKRVESKPCSVTQKQCDTCNDYDKENDMCWAETCPNTVSG